MPYSRWQSGESTVGRLDTVYVGVHHCHSTICKAGRRIETARYSTALSRAWYNATEDVTKLQFHIGFVHA